MERSVSREALRMNSGIGGVIFLLAGEELRLLELSSLMLGVSLPVQGVSLPNQGLEDVKDRCSSMLVLLYAGLGARLTFRLLARLSGRMRLDGRKAAADAFGESTWPPSGEAVTIVPELVPGGGVGLSVLNRG